jgi:hypothetical protein
LRSTGRAAARAGRRLAALVGPRLAAAAAAGFGAYEAVRGDYVLEVESRRYRPYSGRWAGAVRLALEDGRVGCSCEL